MTRIKQIDADFICIICENPFHLRHLRAKSLFIKTFAGKNLVRICQIV